MPKLNTIMDLLDKLDSLEIGVHTERCTLVRHRNSTCSACADACPTGCISVDNQGGINVVPELCVGCGVCTTVCPTCALEPLRPNDAELANMGIKAKDQSDGKPTFACKKILAENKKYDQGKVVPLTCLGRVEEGLLVGLASVGATEIRLACGDCQNCDYQLGIVTAKMIMDSTNHLLEDWNGCETRVKLFENKLPSDVVLMDDDSEAVDAISRRDFFTQIKTSTTSLASEQALKAINPNAEEEEVEVNLLTKVGKEGNLPYFIPNRRERLLDSLERLGEPTSDEIDTRLWGKISIDDKKCSSCRMCSVFCPTGAISKFDGKDGSIGVINRPADCVQCRLCEDICFKDALTLSTVTCPDDLLDGLETKILMAPRAVENNKPDSMYKTLYNLLGGGQIYER
jgi:Pyruvate/2-oxoacid:ferredoxin oxidoreductase delta subunit